MWSGERSLRLDPMSDTLPDHVVENEGPSPSTIAAKERMRRALQMRTAGASFADIDKQLGYAEGGSSRAVARLLKNNTREAVGDFIAVQQERVEQLLLVAWTPAMKGDHAAWDRALRAVQQLDTYYGVGARGGVDVTVNLNGDGDNGVLVIEGDRKAYLAGLQAMASDQGFSFSDDMVIDSTATEVEVVNEAEVDPEEDGYSA